MKRVDKKVVKNRFQPVQVDFLVAQTGRKKN